MTALRPAFSARYAAHKRRLRRAPARLGLALALLVSAHTR